MLIRKYLLPLIAGIVLGLSINFSYSFRSNVITFTVAPILSFIIGAIFGKIKGSSLFLKTFLLGIPYSCLVIFGVCVNPNWVFPILLLFVFFNLFISQYGISKWDVARQKVILIWVGWLFLVLINSLYFVPKFFFNKRTAYYNEKLNDATNLISPNSDIVHLFNFKGKVLLLDFWSTSCLPCIKQFPKIREIDSLFKNDSRIIIIAINNGTDNLDKFKKFCKESTYKLSFLYDDASTLTKSLKIIGFPESVLIDKSGQIRFLHLGYSIDDASIYVEKMKNEITTLINEQ